MVEWNVLHEWVQQDSCYKNTRVLIVVIWIAKKTKRQCARAMSVLCGRLITNLCDDKFAMKNVKFMLSTLNGCHIELQTNLNDANWTYFSIKIKICFHYTAKTKPIRFNLLYYDIRNEHYTNVNDKLKMKYNSALRKIPCEHFNWIHFFWCRKLIL